MNPSNTSYGIRLGEPVWAIKLRIVERHVGVLFALLFVPLNGTLVALLASSYLLRVFALEGIYHRYFAHRAYKANRVVQFILALIGTQNGQRGPLWWAAKHREHHRSADSPMDPHSPQTHSFLYAHLGWFVAQANRSTDLDAVPDLSRFSELRWLDKYYLVPFYGVGVLLFLAGHVGLLGPDVNGMSAVLWGLYVPSFLQIHAIAFVNSVGHSSRIPGGYRRYETADASVNRPILALLTLGAGWHNNHHRYAASARAGFAWFEFDACYFVLRMMSVVGVVSALRAAIPPDVLAEGGLSRTGAATDF